MRTIIDLKPVVAIVETDRDRTRLTLMTPGDIEAPAESICVSMNTEQLGKVIDVLKQAYISKASAERGLKVAP